MRVAERVVVEARLHCRLAVVKRAAKGNVVDVRVDDRDHLELLGARGAPLGVHDEALNPLLPAQPVDRARPRVARCGAHDRNLLPRPHRQEVLKEIAKELERDVLEGEGGAVEELEGVHAVADRHRRRHVRVAEGAVRPGDDVLQLLWRHVVWPDVQRHDLEREILEGEAAPFFGRVGGK